VRGECNASAAGAAAAGRVTESLGDRATARWVRFVNGAREKRDVFRVPELKTRICVGFDWVRFATERAMAPSGARRNAPVGSFLQIRARW
jgi:hypothetical protein